MYEKVIITDKYMRVLFEELHTYGYVDISDTIKELLGNDFKFGKILPLEKPIRDNMRDIIYQTLIFADEIIIYDPKNEIQPNYNLKENKDFKLTFDISDPIEYTVEKEEFEYVANYLIPTVLHNMHENSYSPPDGIINNVFYHNTTDPMLKNYNLEWVIKCHLYAIDINKLQELSATFESPILSKLYDLKTTGLKYNQPIEDYALIKITCRDLIGTLPSFNSIHEILKYRSNRKKDIKRFIKVMDEFSKTVQNDGQANAIKKLCDDINNASKEMAKGSIGKKILSWANILLVPCSVLERLFELPPVALSINVIAYIAKNFIEKKGQKYNWIDLIR